MRGKVREFLFFRLILGITPAYAGKSLKITRSSVLREDHPRLCGEKFSRRFHHIKQLGSPPPMRGKAEFLKNGRETLGITPAYAGKST